MKHTFIGILILLILIISCERNKTNITVTNLVQDSEQNPDNQEKTLTTKSTIDFKDMKTIGQNKPFWFLHVKDSKITKIDEKNQDYKLVQEEINGVRQMYENSKLVTAKIYDSYSIESYSITKLFPDYRFYVISWDQKEINPNLPSSQRPVGLAFDLRFTVAYSSTGSKKKFIGYTNRFKEYGKFLKEHRIRIQTKEDAKLVWDALCEIHCADRKESNNRRLTKNIWHLGIRKVRTTTSFYEVELDDNGYIQSLK